MSENPKPVPTSQVYQWPEFKAFIEKAGINQPLTTNLVIRLPAKGIASFEMEGFVSDSKGVERR